VNKTQQRFHGGNSAKLLSAVLLLAQTFAWPAMAQSGSVDGSFVQSGNGKSAGLDSDVFSAAVQPDGKLVIGGFFTNYNRISRNGLARLNADGSLDTVFNPGVGANGLVETLSLQPDGKTVIVGRFTTYNNVARSYVARVNADGSLDGTFNAGGGPNDIVPTLALQPDGKVLIGGPFTDVNGAGRSYLARLHADGSVDLSFNPAPPDAMVLAIAVQADGKILIGGQFATVGGVSRIRMARLNANGELDSSFDPGPGFSDVVDTLSLQANGKIIVGGGFTIAGGVNRNYVARLNPDGSLDNSFAPNIALAFGGVLAVRAEVDGKVLVGGIFSTINGTSRNNIARLNEDGSLDTTFDPGTGTSGQPYGTVKTIALQADGKIIIGGSFTSVNGVARTRITRLIGNQGCLIEFVNPTYTVNENSGSANIAVRRTGSNSGSVSINYLTSNGTATAGLDYVAQSGAVTFGPGETNKVIQIPVTTDAVSESDETLTVTLGNPVGGVVLGSQSSAVLTIVDNDSAPAFSSILPLPGGTMRVTLNGRLGQTYRLQASTALTNWITIGTNIPMNTPFYFDDNEAGSFGRRFYRAVSP
jgi:uncharacterized delta-60 repeat protein